MKIVFMGTPDFAEESLKAIYEAGFEVVAVVTNPDKPKGRGMQMIATPVKTYAVEKNIKVFEPLKVRNNVELLDELKDLAPDVIVVVAYGKILPKDVLDIPKIGCINVHGSLLPQYRGAAPIQWSVLNGEKYAGITTMFMDEGMDTGDMLLQEKVEVGPNETTGELWDRLKVLGGKLLVDTLKQIENGTYKRIKQPQDATYAPMLDKEMSLIDWNKTNKEIHNLVRGLNPIMGAYSFIKGKKVKIWKTQIAQIDEICDPEECINNENKKEIPGMIYSTKPELVVKTGDGYIELLELQPENSKKMSAKDFLNGFKLEEGDLFTKDN